jgi:hypothetical protein
MGGEDRSDSPKKIKNTPPPQSPKSSKLTPMKKQYLLILLTGLIATTLHPLQAQNQFVPYESLNQQGRYDPYNAKFSTHTLPVYRTPSLSMMNLSSGEDPNAYGEFSTVISDGQAYGEGSLAAVHGNTYGIRSVAIGYGTIANAQNQIALGVWNLPQGNPHPYATSAPTDDLLIVGNGTQHTARSNALTIKRNGDMRLFGNLAMGPTSMATATYSNFGQPTPHYSLANGYNAVATAGTGNSGSFAWGGYSQALHGSFAFGLNAKATGIESFALGGGAQALAPYSTAIGANTTAQGYGQTVIGFYNKPVGNPQPASTPSYYAHPAPDSPIFVIGNGKLSPASGTHNQPSNALTVAYSGATRINGTLTVKNKIRFAPSGDIPMGNYTSGSNPANETY